MSKKSPLYGYPFSSGIALKITRDDGHMFSPDAPEHWCSITILDEEDTELFVGWVDEIDGMGFYSDIEGLIKSFTFNSEHFVIRFDWLLLDGRVNFKIITDGALTVETAYPRNYIDAWNGVLVTFGSYHASVPYWEESESISPAPFVDSVMADTTYQTVSIKSSVPFSGLVEAGGCPPNLFYKLPGVNDNGAWLDINQPTSSWSDIGQSCQSHVTDSIPGSGWRENLIVGMWVSPPQTSINVSGAISGTISLVSHGIISSEIERIEKPALKSTSGVVKLGSGTIESITVSGDYTFGSYLVRFTSATEYVVFDPFRESLGVGVVGKRFSNLVQFRVLEGDKPFQSGNLIEIMVIPEMEPAEEFSLVYQKTAGMDSFNYYTNDGVGELRTATRRGGIPTLGGFLFDPEV